MNIPQRLIVNLQIKSYFIDIITYSMIWCIFTTVSNDNVIIKEEKLLRKFVNFVHSSQNDACTINPRKLSHLLYTTNTNNSIYTTNYNNMTLSTSLITVINLNDTFYPIFDNLINHKTLTYNFIHDIYRSIQIVRYFNRWYDYQQQLISSTSIQLFRKQLEVYLLHQLHSIQLYNNIELLNNSYVKQLHNQYINDNTQSSLIGIGYCSNDFLLMAYVNNYTTNLINSMKINDICNQFLINKQLINNNDNNETIQFNDFQYGKFLTYWAPIQCDANSTIPIVLRYFIYSMEKYEIR
ncbi:hypothetical protein MN116_002583 [Schistosoma mekongi]|uniref:Uncharacterized protein n=1 Tax=Schistosoma mekongi TaxID=38744 RepID=A0AAE1ZFH7_SCHME|nr:hypothetical protein MN116_002583 [Schistosoma mekongi]